MELLPTCMTKEKPTIASLLAALEISQAAAVEKTKFQRINIPPLPDLTTKIIDKTTKKAEKDQKNKPKKEKKLKQPKESTQVFHEVMATEVQAYKLLDESAIYKVYYGVYILPFFSFHPSDFW